MAPARDRVELAQRGSRSGLDVALEGTVDGHTVSPVRSGSGVVVGCMVLEVGKLAEGADHPVCCWLWSGVGPVDDDVAVHAGQWQCGRLGLDGMPLSG